MKVNETRIVFGQKEDRWEQRRRDEEEGESGRAADVNDGSEVGSS